MIPGPLIGFRPRGGRRVLPPAGTGNPDPLPPPTAGAMPGQFVWRNGANNYLFGVNDKVKFNSSAGLPDTTNSPAVVALVDSLAPPIIRQWFPKYRNGKSGTQNTHHDFDVLAGVCENAGSQTLGVLYQWQDVTYMKDVVGFLGPRCVMYEFGNEPFGTDYPYPGFPAFVQQYVAAWKSTVPQLKALNPAAKFMGPSSPGDVSTADAMAAEMVRQGVRPDVFTYHMYGSTSLILSRVDQVRAIVNNHFGPDMPLWLTEWNISGVYPMPAMVGNDAQMHDYVAATLNALVGHVDGAMLFCLAGENQYPQPDLDMIQCNAEANVRAKGSYNGLLDSIAAYHP